jgi:hypothetical protein
MNVEIGTKAAQFPENEYIHGTFFAVRGNQEEAPLPFLAPPLDRGNKNTRHSGQHKRVLPLS